MQHPFEGVLQQSFEPVKDVSAEQTEERPTRRSLLGKMLGAVAGVLGLATAAAAQTFIRRPTTLAYGEEGGRVTTYALGEEGGVTYAWGEAGGWRPPPVRATTYALGEEGGVYPPPRWATTYALGEEGGWQPIYPVPPTNYPTTTALSEEGGSYPWSRY